MRIRLEHAHFRFLSDVFVEGLYVVMATDNDRIQIDSEQVTSMAMIELTPTQHELLRNNGLRVKLYPDKNPYDWYSAWDFLWSALYNGWLDDSDDDRKAAESLLRAMAQAKAEDSAASRGLEAGEAVLLAPLQEQLLVSLHLPAVIYTGLPDEEWERIQNGLLAALRSAGIDDLFEDTYNYVQLCQNTMDDMDKAKRRAEGGEMGRIIDELMEYKRELGFAIRTKYDPLYLEPGKPGGKDIDAYIWEGEVIGAHVFKCDTVERAATVIAYVLSKSFDDAFEYWDVLDIAQELLERMPEDLVEPDDFPSFERDVKPLIDKQFAPYEERLSWSLQSWRDEAVKDGLEPTAYDHLNTIHFLTTFMSDYGLKKLATGETRRPRVRV